ncbi:flagellar brake domain-containing protein (plasmid) [Bacillus sp. 31A1R]|uniref:Flagellar brake domain-containing protein n=1 Tax=Robertmurraya mangrovi TaxID=3098077 RepID=A0ABU5IVJ5_9BACI|nr:flagellar brake domain-containing protein [Bacillus sp. 31A1R]MDZ5471182.1 flagellar brake domain-containing protein [Bacillus sp. 31A1R]
MLKIGDNIILEIKYSDKFEKLKCKLVERKGNHLYIDYPINTQTNKTAFLLDGTQLKGSFVTQEGTVYLFETEVLGRLKQNIPMLILSYPGDEHLIKIQRRQYVRVETAIDIAVHSTDQEFPAFTTVTDDISAGGVAFITNNHSKLKAGMKINTWLVLPLQNGEYHYLKFESSIIRIIPLDAERNKVSVQFTDINPTDRQLLLRFCFDRQLLLKKKGL